MTERLLVRAALDALAIAGKAGLALAGFAKTEAALTHDKVVALIHASDARPDGVGKLAGTLRQRPDADRVVTVTSISLAGIGFGIGAVKCGTCSPAGRTCEQHVSGAFSPP